MRGNLHVIQNRQVFEEPDVLESPGDAFAADRVRGQAGNVLSVENYVSRVRLVDTGNQVEYRSFPPLRWGR